MCFCLVSCFSLSANRVSAASRASRAASISFNDASLSIKSLCRFSPSRIALKRVPKLFQVDQKNFCQAIVIVGERA